MGIEENYRPLNRIYHLVICYSLLWFRSDGQFSSVLYIHVNNADFQFANCDIRKGYCDHMDTMCVCNNGDIMGGHQQM